MKLWLVAALAALAPGWALADDLKVALIYGRTGPLEAYAKQTEAGFPVSYTHLTLPTNREV